MVEKDEEMKKSSKPQVNTENRDELFTRYEELLLKKDQIIKDTKVTSLYDEFYGFKLEKWIIKDVILL